MVVFACFDSFEYSAQLIMFSPSLVKTCIWMKERICLRFHWKSGLYSPL